MMGRYSPMDTLSLAGASSADRNTVYGGGNVTCNVHTIMCPAQLYRNMRNTVRHWMPSHKMLLSLFRTFFPGHIRFLSKISLLYQKWNPKN